MNETRARVTQRTCVLNKNPSTTDCSTLHCDRILPPARTALYTPFTLRRSSPPPSKTIVLGPIISSGIRARDTNTKCITLPIVVISFKSIHILRFYPPHTTTHNNRRRSSVGEKKKKKQGGRRRREGRTTGDVMRCDESVRSFPTTNAHTLRSGRDVQDVGGVLGSQNISLVLDRECDSQVHNSRILLACAESFPKAPAAATTENPSDHVFWKPPKLLSPRSPLTSLSLW